MDRERCAALHYKQELWIHIQTFMVFCYSFNVDVKDGKSVHVAKAKGLYIVV